MGHTSSFCPARPESPVHPHLRGAYACPGQDSFVDFRFIPTYVGHTFEDLCPSARVGGSSPPTWGIRRAGSPPILRRTVHPHLRGAYGGVCRVYGMGGGSSPPTWGIQGRVIRVFVELRFIPTYVGHTQLILPFAIALSVHPHLRGAYLTEIRRTHRTGGSSPPTWGIRRTGQSGVQAVRFIPTYVGHTPHGPRTFCRAPVHPHLRGAYTSTSINSFNASGSSPPTWGIPDAVKIGVQPFWFIPTYVGHTGYRLFTS